MNARKPLKAKSKLARRARTLNARAKQLHVEGRVSKNDLELILAHYGEICIHCGKELDFYKETDSSANDATFDHLLPLDAGGRNDSDNIGPSCRGCNSKRNRQHQLNKLKDKRREK